LYAILLLGMLFSTSGAGYSPANQKAQSRRDGNAKDQLAQNQPAGELRGYGLISKSEGWILVGNSLYWTDNHGNTWNEISPELPATATVQAASFINSQTGWVTWSNAGTDGSLTLQIERTSDQGGNWDNSIIQTLAVDDPAVNLDKASMDWLDAENGWVSIKQKTGSNFNVGTLFRTEDGGETWTRLRIPLGEPVHFVNNLVGWMTGGPAGDQIHKTQDGGKTWEKQTIPGADAGNQSYWLYPPVFETVAKGLIAVVSRVGENSQIGFYSTENGGQSWMAIANLPLDSEIGWLSLSPLDANGLVVAVPNSDRIIRVVNGELSTVTNQDGMSAGIDALEMLDANFGWAKWNTGNCTTQDTADGSTNKSCTSTTKLIETQDGGTTWEALALPEEIPAARTQSYQTATTNESQVIAVGPGKTLTLVGQGFDICEIPTLSKLQTWWNYGPYQSVNLYIGGISRGCPNAALTAAYVNQMRAQGWSFIPTWVGPQAPCTNYLHRFTYDNSYIEGRDEAYLASEKLAQLGLTDEYFTSSVVYYDMEIYGNDTACRNAVNAFMNGWVEHLHDHTWVTPPHDMGNLAGVYGATGNPTSTGCTSGLADYLINPNIPDVIWPARWYHNSPYGFYDPNASVWDVGSCIPSNAWSYHQRIRQYEGDHAETWGGARLPSIDSDVIDGVVAVPYFGTPSPDFSASPFSGPPLTIQFTITNTAFMSSCSWDYGDGETGSSCGYTSTHTYDHVGTYVVSLTVSSPWGTENLTSSRTINVNHHIYLPWMIQ
jgi:photosystem II stability/assembly factor-like uncharacterized protein